MITTIETIDAFLGEHHKRYFGEGHKSSNYEVYPNQIGQKQGIYCGVVQHKKAWSKKAGKTMQPHLSTIDAIILASLALEQELRKMALRLSVENYYLSKFEMKAGDTALENLREIPILIQKSDFKDSNQLFFVIKIGPIKVKLELRCLPAVLCKKPLVGPGPSYLADHLAHVTHELKNIQLAPSYELVADVMATRKQSVQETSTKRGINCRVTTHMSLIEWILIFAQLSQVEAYYYDNLDREQTDVYWMRSLCAEMVPEYFEEADAQIVLGRIDEVKKVMIREDEWHLFAMSGETIDQYVRFSGNMAHCIKPAITEGK